MSNIHELIDNISNAQRNISAEVRFSNLEVKNACHQLQLCDDTSKQGNFSILGGEITGIYQFLTGIYRFGDMPNEFQRLMDMLLKDISLRNCYIDDFYLFLKFLMKKEKLAFGNF